jgi:hypothetical protein
MICVLMGLFFDGSGAILAEIKLYQKKDAGFPCGDIEKMCESELAGKNCEKRPDPPASEEPQADSPHREQSWNQTESQFQAKNSVWGSCPKRGVHIVGKSKSGDEKNFPPIQIRIPSIDNPSGRRAI